jgi:hypothetical protein
MNEPKIAVQSVEVQPYRIAARLCVNGEPVTVLTQRAEGPDPASFMREALNSLGLKDNVR